MADNMLPEAATGPSKYLALNAFSLEVLSYVVALLGGREITHLWIGGNNQLNKRLSARDVVRRFEFNLDTLFPVQWPSIINNFPFVSDFCIPYCAHTRNTLYIEHLLFEAPLTLKSLKLCFAKSTRAFLGALARSPSVFSTLESLEIGGQQINSTTDEAFAIKSLSSLLSLDLGSITYAGALSDFVPPNVTFLNMDFNECDTLDFKLPASLLTFKSWAGTFETKGDLGDLPAGLTKLCLFSEFELFSADQVSRLPRSLRSLNAPIDLEDESIWNALPPSLTSVKSSYDGRTPTDFCIKRCPRSITNLNCFPLLTLENIELLPPHITRLHSLSHDLRIIPKLSPNTRSIQFLGQYSAKRVETSEDVAERIVLPNRLTNLSSFQASFMTSCVLPATLRRLNLIAARFTSEHTRMLPSRLEELLVQDFEPDSLIGLPHGLKTLRAGNAVNSGTFTADLASKLPRTLTSLQLHGTEIGAPEALYALPENLEYLIVQGTDWPESCNLLRAPSSLRYISLIIKDSKAGLGHAILSTLPRRLASLNLSLNGSASLLGVLKESIQRLPPSLTFLRIPDSAEIVLMVDRPPYLPEHLNEIHCGYKRMWLKK